jgi:hypothetical protein
MMHASIQLLFFGEILPGYEAEQVKRTLVARLKIPPGQVGPLFSGRRVVLKQGLTSDAAARYQAQLAALGLRIHVEGGAAGARRTDSPADHAAAGVS